MSAILRSLRSPDDSHFIPFYRRRRPSIPFNPLAILLTLHRGASEAHHRRYRSLAAFVTLPRRFSR